MKLNLLDHGHHHVFIKNHRFCARCLGTYGIGAIAFVSFALLYMAGFQPSFLLIFILSWALAGICIFDWSSVKLGLRQGSNKTRILAGACLGIAYSMYLWLLPVPWIPKLISLIIINTAFGAVVYYVRCKEHGISMLEPAKLAHSMMAEQKMTYACCPTCGCCEGCCCCGLDPILWVVGCVICGALCCVCLTVGCSAFCARVPK